jgi:EAL domain-containing protein (putative c-di-GMP-specific phosphodiesterase class I)
VGLIDRLRSRHTPDEPRPLDHAGNIRRALWLEQFSVHYQPIVDIDTGSLVGMEAFVRWEHPNAGTIPASDFVPAAEQAGLMLPLDIDTLRSATAFRRDLNLGTEELRVTLNLSATELIHPALIDTVQKILGETGLPAQLIEIELARSVFDLDSGRAAEAIRSLHELGVFIAIDDFTSDGFTSNDQHADLIGQLPIDRAKVDFSVLPPALTGDEAEDVLAIRRRGERRKAGRQAIEQAIEQARAWKLDVTAKRIETIEHLTMLRQFGISRAQGYVLGRPVSESEFGDFSSKLRTA